MDLKIIYEDKDVLVVDKPAGVVVFREEKHASLKNDDRRLLDYGEDKKTLIDLLLKKYPELKNAGDAPRYGIVHRLDKDTSGILLVAKSTESLIFLQKQFKSREVEKKYIALAIGVIKEDSGKIETLIGRSPADPRKQKAYSVENPKSEILNSKQIQNSNNEIPKTFTGKRDAITEYKVLQRFDKYTLLEVVLKTGRKHQIRCHLAYIHHPVAGDKLYGFKDSPTPEGLQRQFLHAAYIKITLPRGEAKYFESELPDDLNPVLKKLEAGIEQRILNSVFKIRF